MNRAQMSHRLSGGSAERCSRAVREPELISVMLNPVLILKKRSAFWFLARETEEQLSRARTPETSYKGKFASGPSTFSFSRMNTLPLLPLPSRTRGEM